MLVVICLMSYKAARHLERIHAVKNSNLGQLKI